MKNIETFLDTKFILVFLLYLASVFFYAKATNSQLPIACLITGEQSGEDLAEWFITKTNLNLTHAVHAVASAPLCEKLALNRLSGFDALRNVNIVGGVGNLLKHLSSQQSAYDHLCKKIVNIQPKKLIVVDLPWINLRLIKAIKKTLPSTHITYIAPPELWFWGCWGIDKILKKYCDTIIVLYPHEQAWYAEKGLSTTWLGYPYMRNFQPFIQQETDPAPCLALFPGSREIEIEKTLPFMCEIIKQSKHANDFIILLVKPPSIKTEQLTSIITAQGLNGKITIVPHCNHEEINSCFYALTKPGTSTLQLALLGVPHAVIFKTSWFNKLILDYIVQPKAFGLPNLLSKENVTDEFIHENALSEKLGEHLDKVFESFQKGESYYKLRRHRIDVFRKAFLEHDKTN